MSKNGSELSQQILGSIDEALAQNAALTDQQLEDVQALRTDVETACQSGKFDEARRCETLALKIIRGGAPVPE